MTIEQLHDALSATRSTDADAADAAKFSKKTGLMRLTLRCRVSG